MTLALTNEYPEKYQVVKMLIEYGAELNGKADSPIYMLLTTEYKPGWGMGINSKKNPDTHEEMYRIFMLLIKSGAAISVRQISNNKGAVTL